MAWQQQSGYDNYGGYVDAGLGTNDQQQNQSGSGYGGHTAGTPDPYGAPQTGGMVNADQATYDMFSGDDSGGFNSGAYNPNPSSGAGNMEFGSTAMPNTGYYDPNAHTAQNRLHPQQNRAQPQQTHPQHSPNLASVAGGMFGGGAEQIMSNPVVTGMFGGGAEQIMSNPVVTGMATEYMSKGQEEIKKNLDKYISIGQLKYYFAVDTNYVGKKLGILLFPFAQKDWSIKYNQEQPVQPKYDVNAPDLYIPCMGYMTYILVVGYILGLKNSFSPDLLAATASSSLVWLILELVVIYLTLTVMSIHTSLTKWDVLSFSCYKYVEMIPILLIGLLVNSKTAYYLALAYVSLAIVFFLLRTLKLRIEPEVHGMEMHGKRKLYTMLLYAGLQPIIIWWLTSYLVPVSSVSYGNISGDALPLPTV